MMAAASFATLVSTSTEVRPPIITYTPPSAWDTPPVTRSRYFPAFCLTASWSARSTASPAAAISAWL